MSTVCKPPYDFLTGAIVGQINANISGEGRTMDCPECGSTANTIELGPEVSPMSSVTRAILNADEGDTIGVTRVCWECGWCEIRRVRMDSIHMESGDDSIKRRKNLISEVNAELEEIQHLTSLRDALAEVKRVRRLEPSNKDINE